MRYLLFDGDDEREIVAKDAVWRAWTRIGGRAVEGLRATTGERRFFLGIWFSAKQRSGFAY